MSELTTQTNLFTNKPESEIIDLSDTELEFLITDDLLRLNFAFHHQNLPINRYSILTKDLLGASLLE